MRRKLLKLTSILMTAVILAGCRSGVLKGLKKTDDNLYVNKDKKYEELIDTATSFKFYGSMILATDDEVVLYSGGKGSTINGNPVDPYTTYDIGSCSKTFTAVAIMQLVEQGKVSLDDTLDIYFPDYETGKDITVYNLLHMQSGIPDDINEPDDFWGISDYDEVMEFLKTKYFCDNLTDEEYLTALYAAPLLFEPGTEQSYSNTNYHLLAFIIEEVTGMSYCDYVQKHIFDVCGMEHTTSMVIGNETSVPEGYEMEQEIGMVDSNGYELQGITDRGDGGIHSCAADLLAFDRALFGGKLISESSLQEMMNWDMDYGAGLYPFGHDNVSYGHSGSYGVYLTMNIIYETEDFGRLYLIMLLPTTEPGRASNLDNIPQLVEDNFT
ncbi:MAG: beta-lactamase family protein [Clostridiales bacterium]|nr:beta-lactamase family protein [Clostridiales bacterium]